MAAVSKVNFTLCATLSFLPKHSLKKYLINYAPVISGVRYYRGSARDTRRREWNKKMAEIKREKPKKFDYKQFISTNYEKELFAFAHRLSLNSNNPLLRTAFTHKSFISNHKIDSLGEDNSKLAVLGYNITTQFISEFLFFSFANFPMFGLRSFKEYLLSRNVLVNVAKSLSIVELIRSPYNLDSTGEIIEENVTKDDIISDTLLAIVASIYLDESSAKAHAFVNDFIIVELYGKELESVVEIKNPEISLTALLLQQNKEKPQARVISRNVKYTDTPVYVVGLFSSQLLLGTGVSNILEKAKHKNECDVVHGTLRVLNTIKAYCSALTKLLQRHLPQMAELSSINHIL